MKKFLNEFKEFAVKGSVINLAIGVIIGAAFQSVVSSLTENILSPIIGLFTGSNFDALQIEFLGVTLKYGAFITSVINFVIMAFVVFLMVRAMNKIMSIGKKPDAPADPTTRTCPYCMSEVNLKATRCPACTSELKQAAAGDAHT